MKPLTASNDMPGMHLLPGSWPFLSGGGAEGALPRWILTTQKGQKFAWYVARSAISRCVAAAAKFMLNAAIDFWIFFKPFLNVLWDIWIPEPRGVQKGSQPFNYDTLNPAAYIKGPQFWIFREISGPLNHAP